MPQTTIKIAEAIQASWTRGSQILDQEELYNWMHSGILKHAILVMKWLWKTMVSCRSLKPLVKEITVFWLKCQVNHPKSGSSKWMKIVCETPQAFDLVTVRLFLMVGDIRRV